MLACISVMELNHLLKPELGPIRVDGKLVEWWRVSDRTREKEEIIYKMERYMPHTVISHEILITTQQRLIISLPVRRWDIQDGK